MIDQKYLSYLVCPNDGNKLSFQEDSLSCNLCSTKFSFLNENTVELVSKNSLDIKTSDTKSSYSKYYSDLRNIGHPESERMRLWGLESKSGFVSSMINQIKKFTQNKIVSDIGAGVGNYSISMAENAEFVFHCDLDLESINAARKRAHENNIKNILFIRCDYLSLPFKKNSLPCVTCIDVLERGREHDSLLLCQLSNSTMNDGILITDYHSKERTKLNRASDWDRRYSKSEIVKTLQDNDQKNLHFYGMGHSPKAGTVSPSKYEKIEPIFKLILPPARWLVVSHKSE